MTPRTPPPRSSHERVPLYTDGSSHLMYDPYSHEQSCNSHQHQQSHRQNKRIEHNILVERVAQYRRERGQSEPQSAGQTLALRVPHQETVADRSDDWNQWDCYTEAHEDEVDPGHEVGVVQGVVREAYLPAEHCDVKHPPDVELEHAVVEDHA